MLAEFQILILAMAPLTELNGSIPVAMTVFHFPLWRAFLISFLGNLVPVIFLLFFLEPISKFLSGHFKVFKNFFDWLFYRTREKIQPEIKKYGKIGLVSFISLPFPLTGGWTGAVAAFLMGISFRPAFFLISLGILINGVIISILTLSGIAIEKYFGWQALITIVAVSVLVYLIFRVVSRKSQSS